MAIVWAYAEKDSASDDSLVVVSLCASDGQEVMKGQLICEMEGSKSAFEANAPVGGIVFIYVEEGANVSIGQPLFCISDEKRKKPQAPGPQDSEALEGPTADRFSKKALEAILSRGGDPKTFRPELDFVTLSDVVGGDSKATDHLQSNKIERIAILGGSFGSTLAYEVISTDSSKVAVGVFDDMQNMLEVCNVPFLGKLDKAEVEKKFLHGVFDSLFISIQANSTLREDLANWSAEKGIPLATLVHPGALVSRSAAIEEGALVMDGSRVATHARLARNVFLSAMVNIDHHCEIGANSTFGPGVFISGGVSVGSGVSFSSGIVVEPHCQIGDRVFVSSGAVIRKNIADGTVVKVRGNIETD